MGFGLLVFTGWQSIKDDVSNIFQSMFAGLPADVYAIVAMAGFVDAVGIWLSALTIIVGVYSFKKFLVMR